MPKAQLFLTCLGDQFYTDTPQNMVLVLERLGVNLIFPPEQTCLIGTLGTLDLAQVGNSLPG